MNPLKTLSILLALICCLSIGSAYATGDAPSELTGRLKTPYFDVHYDRSDPFMAKLMADTAHDELMRVSRDLGYTPPKGRPFSLYVYLTHVGFIRAGGLETSKFTVGTANSGNETLSVDASGAFALPEEVLAHEITHAVIFRILGPNVGTLPLWFNEGLAKHESDDFRADDEQTIADAASNGELISLDDLRVAFPKDRTGLAYAESTSAVKYVIDKHGKSAPKKLLRELARIGSFDEAARRTIGVTGEQIADDWYAKTTRRYWQVRLGRVAMAVVSALMAVLVVVAFLVRRKQKMEAAKAWEWEEFEERMRRQLGDDPRGR